MRLLDVGCGWGSLVLHAAATTTSRRSGSPCPRSRLGWRASACATRGSSDRIEIRVSDYRELTDGPFDKIASVGMYEHVGRSELDAYAATVTGCCVRAVGSSTTESPGCTPSSPATETFIWRYIFPDGELHPVTEVSPRCSRTRASRSATSNRCATTTR